MCRRTGTSTMLNIRKWKNLTSCINVRYQFCYFSVLHNFIGKWQKSFHYCVQFLWFLNLQQSADSISLETSGLKWAQFVVILCNSTGCERNKWPSHSPNEFEKVLLFWSIYVDTKWVIQRENADDCIFPSEILLHSQLWRNAWGNPSFFNFGFLKGHTHHPL